MSGRGYRARALAELANSSTFNYRGHIHELRRASAEASLLSDEEAGPAGHTRADGALQDLCHELPSLCYTCGSDIPGQRDVHAAVLLLSDADAA